MRLYNTMLQEELRLQELHAHQILDSPPEQVFDDLAQLAAHIFGCPIAAITFVDKDRQWTKAALGMEGGAIPREHSFCHYTIGQSELMIVADATRDARFKHSPLINDPGIRFYAGAPIVSSNGYNLGAICVCDKYPRHLGAEQMSMLQVISRQVSKLLELRQRNHQLQAEATSAIHDQHHFVHNSFLRHERANFDLSTTLHEDLAQGLAAAKLYLEMAAETGSKEFINKAKENVAQMLEDARSLSKKLAPTTLKYGCIADQLQQQLSFWQTQTGITTQLFCSRQQQLMPDLYLVIYRMVEEQLKNIAAHASATEATVGLQIKNELRLVVTDNGKGFDTERFKAGLGLRTVISAAEYYGGSVDITAKPSGGCTLEICIPILQRPAGGVVQPQQPFGVTAMAHPTFFD